jgi:hypothetical protein
VSTSAASRARSIESLLVIPSGGVGHLPRERKTVKAALDAARLLEPVARREYVGFVVAAVITRVSSADSSRGSGR